MLLFILTLPVLIYSETLKISTIEGSPVSEICSIILTGIYEQAGLELEILTMPATRATKELTTGAIDGETHRIITYNEIYPQLLIVPLSYYSIDTVLYTQENNPARYVPVEDFPKFSFAILKGVKRAAELTENFPNVKEFDTSDIMMRFLELERTDFALISRINGNFIIKDLEIKGLVHREPPVERTFLYHFLHYRHRNLVPVLEETISRMGKSGELEELVKRAESRVLGD